MLGVLMTMCSVYVGNLNDPSFNWDQGEGIPKCIIGNLPPDRKPYLRCFHEWVEKSGVECKKTWYEVWVARVSKAQIHDYIEYGYGSDPGYNDPDKMLTWEGRPYLGDRLDSVKELVSGY